MLAERLKKKRYWMPLSLFLFGMLLPNHWVIPVQGATSNDWNDETFWYEPWGSSVTHKGIDIFGAKDTPVIAANHGILIFKGDLKKGGKVLAYLGPEWKIHYYAHLENFAEDVPFFVSSGTTIATLGATGNAKNKPPHLHFSIVSLLPYFWKIDLETHGWKKPFYLDPNDYLEPS